MRSFAAVLVGPSELRTTTHRECSLDTGFRSPTASVPLPPLPVDHGYFQLNRYFPVWEKCATEATWPSRYSMFARLPG